MPFECSTPLVVGCLLAAVVALVAGLRMQAGWLLMTAALLALGGAGAFVADRLVVTDREHLMALFPRLARAAERPDVAGSGLIRTALALGPTLPRHRLPGPGQVW